MNYKQTLDYLFNRLPMYQKEGHIAYKENIGNIIKASSILGDPHRKFKSIHIAGTNGKGSTAHMIKSILQEAKYKIGLYTSPHLKDLRERIKINGEMIPEKDVVEFVQKNKNDFEEIDLSFFEFMVSLAFNHFAKNKVDIAIIETGLGGRLDSTNIIHPILSIITNISLDHTNLLGETIEEIAKEKGGIIKKNTPVVIGKKQKRTKTIFEDIANKKNAHIIYTSDKNYISDLQGNYQKDNINTVIAAISSLQKKGWEINENNIRNGLLNTRKNTGISGRWQILNKEPLTICDIGHNKEGIENIVQQIQEIPHKKLHIVFGTVVDKEIDDILNQLPKDAIYYFCKANIPRGLNTSELKYKASKYDLKGEVYSSVKDALSNAIKQSYTEDLIFIGGSTFVVAEIL